MVAKTSTRIYLYELILFHAAYAVMIHHIFSALCFFQWRIERLGGMLARRFATRHATTSAAVSYRTSTFTPLGWDSLHLYLQTPCEVNEITLYPTSCLIVCFWVYIPSTYASSYRVSVEIHPDWTVVYMQKPLHLNPQHLSAHTVYSKP